MYFRFCYFKLYHTHIEIATIQLHISTSPRRTITDCRIKRYSTKEVFYILHRCVFRTERLTLISNEQDTSIQAPLQKTDSIRNRLSSLYFNFDLPCSQSPAVPLCGNALASPEFPAHSPQHPCHFQTFSCASVPSSSRDPAPLPQASYRSRQ